jgi:hypothetical protein
MNYPAAERIVGNPRVQEISLLWLAWRVKEFQMAL